jgi:hypothetical protein
MVPRRKSTRQRRQSSDIVTEPSGWSVRQLNSYYTVELCDRMARCAGAANHWGSTPWPPRTHQEKKKATLTNDLLRPPDWKFTPHALGLKTGSALVVAD